MFRVFLIGFDGHLAADSAKALAGCGTVFASKRLQASLDLAGKTVLPVTPVAEMLAGVAKISKEQDVAVLASGDPLFFGISRRLLQEVDPELVTIFPARSSMQMAAARFKIPWDDAAYISLHGRDMEVEISLLLHHKKSFVFTDRVNSPGAIACRLLDLLDHDEGAAAGWTVWVGEQLGLPEEKISTGSLAEIAARTFDPLNIMLLVRGEDFLKNSTSFGLQEEQISHSRGLITKNEVRAVTIHGLCLPQEGVLWDIGAGSGSVSLEAALLRPNLQVFAVERHPEQLAHIRENRRRYGVYNIHIIDGEAPDALDELPDPDRVFIGGSGGHLQEIITYSVGRLAGEGRVVVNAVIEETRKKAPALLYGAGLSVTMSDVSVSRHSFPETDRQERAFNSIRVCVGIK